MNFTAAILGCGNRGAETYAKLLAEKENFSIVSLCERDGERLAYYGELFSVPAEARFSSEEPFFERKRADLLVIATMDADHVRQAVKALSLGYDLLLEKPVSDKREELEELRQGRRLPRSALCARLCQGGRALKGGQDRQTRRHPVARAGGILA